MARRPQPAFSYLQKKEKEAGDPQKKLEKKKKEEAPPFQEDPSEEGFPRVAGVADATRPYQ